MPLTTAPSISMIQEPAERFGEFESLAAEPKAWYAVCTRARHEKVAYRDLREREVESFLPLREVLSQWKDRRKLVKKPLFTGYLFVQADRSELDRVVSVRGVAYILGCGHEPVPIPDDQIKAVRQLVEGPYPVLKWPWLRVGRRVRVTTGPLTGLETCIVQRRNNSKSYLVVTVDLLGRSLAVEVDPTCVELIL